jgi:hypothetical protein
MTTFWLVILGVGLPIGVSSFLVGAMLAGELIEWRRERRMGELLEHLAKEGQGILQRERGP